MKSQEVKTLIHSFGGDKKKEPLLIIEVLFNPDGPDTGALIAHKWFGEGSATRKEINALIKHYRSNDFTLIADYLEAAGI